MYFFANLKIRQFGMFGKIVVGLFFVSNLIVGPRLVLGATKSCAQEFGVSVSTTLKHLKRAQSLGSFDRLPKDLRSFVFSRGISEEYLKIYRPEALLELSNSYDRIKSRQAIIPELGLTYAYLDDISDAHRTYGYYILKKNDPLFSSTAYIEWQKGAHERMAASWAVENNYASSFIHAWRGRFDRAWEHLSPKTEVQKFTLTGSEAVLLRRQFADSNLFWQIKNGYIRKGPKSRDKDLAGRIIGLGKNMYGAAVKNSNGTVQNYIDIDDSEIRTLTAPARQKASERLSKSEKQTLEKIESEFSQGASLLFMEPVNAMPPKVTFYRPVFVRALQKLCREYEVWIFADEILSGGGRTGKFFAHEWYEGFDPDIVSFGKGLMVSGVAVNKNSRASDFALVSNTTIVNYASPLVYATLLLERIRSGNLMSKALEVGNYIRANVLENPNIGEGLLFGADPGLQELFVSGSERYFMPLGLTIEDVKMLQSRLHH